MDSSNYVESMQIEDAYTCIATHAGGAVVRGCLGATCGDQGASGGGCEAVARNNSFVYRHALSLLKVSAWACHQLRPLYHREVVAVRFL